MKSVKTTLVFGIVFFGSISVGNTATIDAKDVQLSSGWDVETVFNQTFAQIRDLDTSRADQSSEIYHLQMGNLLRDDAIQQAEKKGTTALLGVAQNGSDIIKLQQDQDTQNQVISGVDKEAKLAGALADTADKKADTALQGVVQNGSTIIALDKKTDKAESDAVLADAKAEEAKKSAVSAKGIADLATVKAGIAQSTADHALISATNADNKADANSQLIGSNTKNINENRKALSSKVENTTFKTDQDRQDADIANVQTQAKDNSGKLANHESRITRLESQNNARFSSVERQQNEDRKEYRAGIAGVGAIAGLHYVDTDNAVAVGAANFKDAQGYAMGYRHKFSENIAATMSASGTSNGDEVMAASASIGW